MVVGQIIWYAKRNEIAYIKQEQRKAKRISVLEAEQGIINSEEAQP